MYELTLIQKIAVFIVPVLFAITLHEVAHGYVASLFGDQTAKFSGRLSLNPIHHIDLLGTIVVPLLMLLATNFIFGWAKPVPVDPRNLHNPRRDMAFVALAGPGANLLMAIFWGLMLKIGMLAAVNDMLTIGIPLIYMGKAGIMINVVLAVLNFIPLPPLDGSKILSSLLPPHMAYKYNQIEPYGIFILVLLMLTNVLSTIMTPIIFFFLSLINTLLGI